MSDVEQRLTENEDFATVEDGRKKKKTLVIKEKIVMSPRRAKKKPSYIRQNTFNLDEENVNISPLPKPKKLSIEPLRAKSSYGIKAILERAESISGLTPQVK